MRVRARSSAVSSRTCAFSRWRGALIVFSPYGPLRARLKERFTSHLSHSTWRSSVVSTERAPRGVSGAPALDGPAVVLDRDAACLHHEPPGGQGHHDLLRPLAVPHDQIGPAPGGYTIVTEIENTGRMARDRRHEVAHQVSRAHVGRDGADEGQMSQIGRPDRREGVPDIVRGQGDGHARLQQLPDRRETAARVALVASAQQVEIREGQADDADAGGGELGDQRRLFRSGKCRQLGEMTDGDAPLPAGADRLAKDLAYVQMFRLVTEVDVEIRVD